MSVLIFWRLWRPRYGTPTLFLNQISQRPASLLTQTILRKGITSSKVTNADVCYGHQLNTDTLQLKHLNLNQKTFPPEEIILRYIVFIYHNTPVLSQESFRAPRTSKFLGSFLRTCSPARVLVTMWLTRKRVCWSPDRSCFGPSGLQCSAGGGVSPAQGLMHAYGWASKSKAASTFPGEACL